MAEGVNQMLQAPEKRHEDQWMIMQDTNDDDEDIYNNTSSTDDNSSTTDGSTSSSSDLADDASSPTSTLLNSSSNSKINGPLFQLSDLMSHLPIKRGLSKYYQGKSQSFTSLSRVTSIEDLPKKESSYTRRKLKTSKSYANGLDAHKPYTLPKAIISKKVSRSSLSSLSFPSRRGSNSTFLNSSRPPPSPILKKF